MSLLAYVTNNISLTLHFLTFGMRVVPSPPMVSPATLSNNTVEALDMATFGNEPRHDGRLNALNRFVRTTKPNIN